MPNFVSALKSEVMRLARKEIRKEVDGLRKASSSYRKHIADLKRQVEALSKASGRTATKNPSDTPEAGPEVTKIRFSAKGFATHRKRLGISAAEAAGILGVSPQTVYGWETGRSKPRRAQFAAIATFRSMGKRDVKKRLLEIAGNEEI